MTRPPYQRPTRAPVPTIKWHKGGVQALESGGCLGAHLLWGVCKLPAIGIRMSAMGGSCRSVPSGSRWRDVGTKTCALHCLPTQ